MLWKRGLFGGPKSFRLIRDAYDDVEVRPERFIDAGDEVVVLARLAGTSRGARSNRAEEGGGKAIRFCWFSTASEALEAAGLRE